MGSTSVIIPILQMGKWRELGVHDWTLGLTQPVADCWSGSDSEHRVSQLRPGLRLVEKSGLPLWTLVQRVLS